MSYNQRNLNKVRGEWRVFALAPKYGEGHGPVSEPFPNFREAQAYVATLPPSPTERVYECRYKSGKWAIFDGEGNLCEEGRDWHDLD